MSIVQREFYERDTLTVAWQLLGKTLVHETAEGTTKGMIVETEAYMGPEDKASHAYGNLRTGRTEVLYGPKGHAYVYLIYGMYHCLNITSGKIVGKPEAVLVRALQPLVGIETMMRRRRASDPLRLMNGPGRLCMAMGITRKQSGVDLCSQIFFLGNSKVLAGRDICQSERVNVDYAEEWKVCPWRFYVRGCKFVSK